MCAPMYLCDEVLATSPFLSCVDIQRFVDYRYEWSKKAMQLISDLIHDHVYNRFGALKL